jgi:hypothetical protein
MAVEAHQAKYLLARLRDILAPFCRHVSGRASETHIDVRVEGVIGRRVVDPPKAAVITGGLFGEPELVKSPVPLRTVPCNILHMQWATTERAAFILEWRGGPEGDYPIPEPDREGKVWLAELKPSWMAYALSVPEETLTPLPVVFYLTP